MISPDALDKLLEVLRKRLINEIAGASCPKCGNKIAWGTGEWAYSHLPYYEIGDTTMVGYRCPKSEDPIVVFKVSLGSLIKELKGERGGTRYLE